MHTPIAHTQSENKLAAVRAELSGDNRCTALGISAHANAPVLDLCRKLLVAGYDLATPLEAWRGETLCLSIRSIAEGAGLTVEDDRHGTPRLRRWRGSDGSMAAGYGRASPIEAIGAEVPEVPL
jgi:hypothetical protein